MSRSTTKSAASAATAAAVTMTTPAQLERLGEHLRKLRLLKSGERLEALLQQAAANELPYAEFLEQVLSEEVAAKRIPYLHRYARQRHPTWERLDLVFELWTTGELTANALEKIARLQASVSPERYRVVVRQAAELGRMAKDTGDQSLCDVLAQHFFNHPLADPTGMFFAAVAPAPVAA
jgi:hypothetical protein